MNFIDWNDNDPRLNNLFTDNIKLTKENKKLRDKVLRMEGRLNEIESHIDKNKAITKSENPEDDFHLSDYDVPESNTDIYIITALLVMFIIVMLIGIFQGGVAF